MKNLYYLIGGILGFIMIKEFNKPTFEKIYRLVKDVVYNSRYSINPEMVLAVIHSETGLKTIESAGLFGDINLKNKAIGIMQVRKPALTDVNNFYGYNFTENDLEDTVKNIIVGAGYLDLCYKQSKQETTNEDNRIFLTFKKYNAGIGTKIYDESGLDYAIETYDFYNKLINEQIKV